ncbi:MAG: patatin-like phospholipase family protein [Pseudomonadota bacterium]
MKVGLCLGGGGARGLSHIVVFEILDELGVKVAAISGSSIGALLGMGYAGGMSGREIRSYTLSKFSDSTQVLAQLWSLRPANIRDWFNPQSYSIGQIDPEKILSFYTPVDDLPERIEDLEIPLRVIATDYYAWRDIEFASGPLKPAVAASIAIPLVFKPMRVNGKVIIDGNITNPLPVDRLKKDGLDRVIAVDVVGGPLDDGTTEIPTGIESILGANQIMMQELTRQKLNEFGEPDVLIRPPINRFGVLDFLKASTIVRVTDAIRDDIKREIAEALEAA